MKILQVTDCHLVPPGIQLLGLDPRERLAAVIADINVHHQDADLCVLTGDLADRGDPRAYAQLVELLSGLTLPYRLIIGNHDNRDHFRAAFPEAPCDDNGFIQSVLDGPKGRLLFLDTMREGASAGEYCPKRLKWLADRLAEAEGRPSYIFLHHPPFDVGIPAMDNIRLTEEGPLREVLARAGDLRHLFFGHVHRPVSGWWQGISYSAIRGTAHQVPLVLEEGMAVPYSLTPPAYGVILIGDDQVTVHMNDFQGETRLPMDMIRYTQVP